MDHFVDKLKEIEQTYLELEEKLADPSIVSDQTNYKRLAKARHQLRQTVEAYNSTVYQTESQLLVTGRKLEKLGAGSEKKITEPRLVEETPKSITAPELKR